MPCRYANILGKRHNKPNGVTKAIDIIPSTSGMWIILQWTPKHLDALDNEHADRLAKVRKQTDNAMRSIEERSD